MDTLILIFAVVFVFYLQIDSTFGIKKHFLLAQKLRKDLLKKYPGIGKDYTFSFDLKGVLHRIDLKGDKKSNERWKKFEKKEQELEEKNTESTALDGSSVFIPKKFDFRRNDINFFLYNRNYKNGINLKNLDFSKYDVHKPTKVVTHGYMGSRESGSCVQIKNNYLNVSDINVIIIDWSPLAGNVIYPLSAAATGDVADYTAEFIACLIKHVEIKQDKFHLIGHSLGAHVMGFTGIRLQRYYDYIISRITGLDPALHLFNFIHINKRDANFVDIIHTDGNIMGLNQSIGHVDFYPNGGDSPQPGCTYEFIWKAITCSHSASWDYFAKSIKEVNKYIAKCTDGKMHPMGSGTPSNARGICSLDTDPDDDDKDSGWGLLSILRSFFSLFF